MVLGFFHLVLCTDESLSWARLFLHVFFVLILLQQRRHNQRRCKWSCHQWLTTSTKTYDLWLKLRCCLFGLFFRVHCTLITKTKICVLSLGGLYNVSVEPALDLQVLCELSWSSVLLLPVSRWTLSGFGTRKKKETKTRRENESWKVLPWKRQNPIGIINDEVCSFVSRSIEWSAGCGRMRLNMLMTLPISSRCSW